MGLQTQRSRFERHPRLTLLALVGALTVLLALVLELGLRATLDYHIDYYAGVTRPGRIEYPYGPVYINAHGHPDLEWDLDDSRPRLGFYGDSVTYGVGAGHGHRLSDLVREARPERQVLTFAAVGARLKDPERVRRLARDFGLETLVYVMNLNDVTPDRPRTRRAPKKRGREAARPAGTAPGARADGSPASQESRESPLRRLRKVVIERFDFLRNKSYLYNFLRLRVKNLLVLRGFEASGFQAVELEPSRHGPVFDATAARVNETGRLLAEEGVRFCVLLLPYEMQVSAAAAARYRELGVGWEEGFLEGSAQREIARRLDPGIERLDALAAFVDPADPERSRARNPLRTYFVHDRGDKIDWNHPTREGHRRIAELALRRHLCGL